MGLTHIREEILAISIVCAQLAACQKEGTDSLSASHSPLHHFAQSIVDLTVDARSGQVAVCTGSPEARPSYGDGVSNTLYLLIDGTVADSNPFRSEERRVGKECR